MASMLVSILVGYVDLMGEEAHEAFESEEDGRDGFACAILALLWARSEFEERCGVGARARALQINVADEGCDRYPWRGGWRTPGVDLA